MGANSFPTVVDKLLFDEISDIAVCGDGFAYTTVVDFLLNEYFSVALNPGFCFIYFILFISMSPLTHLSRECSKYSHPSNRPQQPLLRRHSPPKRVPNW